MTNQKFKRWEDEKDFAFYYVILIFDFFRYGQRSKIQMERFFIKAAKRNARWALDTLSGLRAYAL